jgi:superfamily II DNA/RNA helicase
MEHKAYLHRSGRTARAGKEGEVVTLVLPEQRKDTAALLRKAAISVTPQQVTASSDAVTALVGEVAAYVKPLPRVEQPQQQGGRGRSQGANAQRKQANRTGQPARTDRSGRPAQERSSRPAAAASGAPRQQRDSAPRTEQAPRRTDGSRRAGAPAGSGNGARRGR